MTMIETSDPAPARRFRLVRWFMIVSLLTIGAITAISAEALSRYLTNEMLERDMAVSADFVNSVVRVQKATSYFHGDTIDPNRPEMEEFFRHVASLPDVLRANVYGRDRSILWSSDPALIGRRFDENDELEAAFRNDVHPEIEVLRTGDKEEHVGFPVGTTTFVENYLPIWSDDDSFIVGAVELYKSPETLLASIDRARLFIWVGAGIAGLLVFLGLTVVVRYAGRILAGQEARIVEAERLAVVGEMTSAVAHGLRNPLAAIRSCAELALEDNLEPETRDSIQDIVRQSDRLESWIRGFLTRSHEAQATTHLCRVDDVLRASFESFAPQLAARRIDWEIEAEGTSPLVKAPPADLTQVLNCLISNGIEAIDRDGRLSAARVQDGGGAIRIELTDTGPGIGDASQLFTPLVSGKSSGLGVGLSLARRTVERLGGSLEIVNAPGGGALARIALPGHQEIAA